MPQGRDRWIALGLVAGLVLVIIGAAAVGGRHTADTSSASDTSDAWVSILRGMQGPAHDALYASQAGNGQGVLTAKTKLAKSCDDAKALADAGSARGQTAQQAVRSACADYGFPLR
jgi:hypothetical protein